MVIDGSYRLYGGPNLLLIAAAAIPAVLLMIYVYRKDRLEKEPLSLLLRLLFQGIIATALAAYAERVGVRLLSAAVKENTLPYHLIFNFLVVGVTEEGVKYLLLYRRTWRSPHFNCQFDAVVYAVFMSLGFALWENVEYVAVYGFGAALIRAVTAVPGHACFGVFMGAWYGLAKAHEIKGHAHNARVCLWLAAACPALLHGLYDFIASVDASDYTLFFFGFTAALFAFAVTTVRRLSREDRMI